MSPLIKNTLAIFAGIIVGSIVNMGIITIGGSLIPPPSGADLSTMDGLKNSMHLFQPKHFVMPFLAHALGTLSGALLSASFATDSMKSAMAIGVFFLLGGIINAFLLPAPLWFIVLDLVLAYIPMSILGDRLSILFKAKLKPV